MLYVYLHKRFTFGAVFSSVALIIVSPVHMYIYVFTVYTLRCSFYTVFTCFVSHAYSHYCIVRITSQILFVFHAGESHLVSELLLYVASVYWFLLLNSICVWWWFQKLGKGTFCLLLEVGFWVGVGVYGCWVFLMASKIAFGNMVWFSFRWLFAVNSAWIWNLSRVFRWGPLLW